MNMKRVGVLDLQGGVEEHLNLLSTLENVKPIAVKYKEQLNEIDGLIIPGGESTTLGKLLDAFGIITSLKKKIAEGLPVWGTCAGMILLAKEIEGEETKHIAQMDICVKRNAYGRQLGSFSVEKQIEEVAQEVLPLVFIRAPFVKEAKENVEILLRIEDKIVACKQDNMLATAFHPELTGNNKFHSYFVDKFIDKGSNK